MTNEDPKKNEERFAPPQAHGRQAQSNVGDGRLLAALQKKRCLARVLVSSASIFYLLGLVGTDENLAIRQTQRVNGRWSALAALSEHPSPSDHGNGKPKVASLFRHPMPAA